MSVDYVVEVYCGTNCRQRSLCVVNLEEKNNPNKRNF